MNEPQSKAELAAEAVAADSTLIIALLNHPVTIPIGLVLGYFALQLWILPAFGIRT